MDQSPTTPNQVRAIIFTYVTGVIQGSIICIIGFCVLCLMLVTDNPFVSFGNILTVGYFYPMRMTGIVIIGPSDGALINCVHLCNLKSVENAPSFLKGVQKDLLEMVHVNITSIFNTNRKLISVKLSLATLDNGVGCTSHKNYLK